jgi:hypothetical protein
MRRTILRSGFLILGVFVLGSASCGSSFSGGGTGGTTGTAGGSVGAGGSKGTDGTRGSGGSAGTGDTAGAGGSVGAGGTVGSGEGSCSGTLLTVKNYDARCMVTVGTSTPFISAVQTVCEPMGTVALTATPDAGYQLGTDPWHDTTTQALGAATETVTGTGSACVWVCCEGTGLPPSPPCPTTDQCM